MQSFMRVDKLGIAARVAAAVFGSRTPPSERLAWEAPLRADLFRKVVWGCAAILAILGLLLAFDGTTWKQMIWTTFEPAALTGVAAWLARKSRPLTAILLLLIALSHAAAFTQAQYPDSDWPAAVLALTIVMAGLLVGAYFVRLWTAICCGVLVWVRAQAPETELGWGVVAIWCGIYVATAALVELFSRHLERLLDASRVAEEQKRIAIVAERIRFARDIHDTLTQGFTGIVTQLNAAEQRLSESNGARPHLEKARALARSSLEEARRSAQALRPGALAEGTLLEAIEQVGRNATTDSEIGLETCLEGQPYALDEQTEVNLLRIAQEAMTNAVRHSGTERICIRLAYSPGKVRLEIRDTGCGMSGAEVAGLGIRGMRERAQQMRAQMQISTNPGHGTQVVVTLPNA
jgi:signal transduction histidine kinase